MDLLLGDIRPFGISHAYSTKGSLMKRECEECDRLWKAYTQATIEHVHLQVQQERAALEHDRAKASQISASVIIAERAWAKARHEVHVHEAQCFSVPCREKPGTRTSKLVFAFRRTARGISNQRHRFANSVSPVDRRVLLVCMEPEPFPM